MPIPEANADAALNQTLDPQDWEEFRRLAHTALDEAIDYVRDVRQRPVWQPVPESVKSRLDEALPIEPQGIQKTLSDFQELVLPYPTGNIHPRFWGWVQGTGLATGLISDLMTSALNANCGGRDHGALYVERRVIEWCRQMLGYPASSSGIVVSGTSMSTVIALAVARNARAGCDVRADGLACAPKPLVLYASTEVHSCLVKALELLGLGRSSLHKIPVDDDFTIDINTLRQAIREDRDACRQPFCVVGCAGTVNTGAIDDLSALADLCQEEKLWFHVDGAFGAMGMLSDALRPLLRGLERSDSIAFDFHKWMYVQYDAGCVLIRDHKLHAQAFAGRPDYLQHADRGLAGGGEWFTDLGPELSRGFRALKIWFALKEYGTRRFGELIEQNCRQARYLATLVQANPALELLAPVPLNIVCFRYRTAELDGQELDQLNRDIVADLQVGGIAAPSTTRIHGQLAIRVAITNHRSRREDFDLLVESVIALGQQRLQTLARVSSSLPL